VQTQENSGRGPNRSEAIPELLTARELEATLKIDAKTIYAYARKGLIPYVRIQRNVRFSKWEIREWIEKQSYRSPQGKKSPSISHAH
jgi:hypothetical protein